MSVVFLINNWREDDFLSSPSTRGTMSIIIILILGGAKEEESVYEKYSAMSF